MRRAVFAAVLTVTTALSGACAALPFGSDDSHSTHQPAPTQTGPVPTSHQFDQPFPVAGDSWDATVTLSDLRIVPSSVYSDTVLAVDVRAVQSAGQPELGPDDFSAYSPAGTRYERIQSPAGIVADPLVPSVMTSPGEEIRGMVAWTMPPGERVGRIEVTSPRTLASLTVTRQPADPSAQPAGSAAS